MKIKLINNKMGKSKYVFAFFVIEMINSMLIILILKFLWEWKAECWMKKQ